MREILIKRGGFTGLAKAALGIRSMNHSPEEEEELKPEIRESDRRNAAPRRSLPSLRGVKVGPRALAVLNSLRRITR